jgi:integrase
MWADGNRLYLLVRPSVSGKGITRSWVFRYQRDGRSVDIGLGASALFGLAEARQRALVLSRQLADGIDPRAHRNAERARRKAKADAARTFDQVAEEYIRAKGGEWVEDHHSGWVSTLRDHVSPAIGRLPVGEIDTAAVLRVLKPIWHTKTRTAANVRGRIERILAYAQVSGYTPDGRPNPAAWTGHLKELLPSPNKLHTVQAMKALPYAELPALMRRLGEIADSMPAVMLMFAAHTAVRSWDIRHARREHIDPSTGSGLWTIPAFSKTRVEHRVPLTPAALALIERAIRIGDMTGAGAGGLLFPNPFTGVEFADNFAGKLIAKLGLAGTMTMHGLRATFRTWCQDGEVDRELAERCLGHTVGGKAEEAYKRSDLLRRRTVLMEKWSAFLVGAEAKVVPITRGKRG